jgi:hypothetical protein
VSGFRLRYVRDTNDGIRFKHTRYPSPWNPAYPSVEQAEIVKAAMPWPEKWEVVPDGE